MSEQDKMNDYDSEPVFYCSKCYSLNIIHEDAIDSDCCKECGCSDVKTANIEEWESLYETRYGHKFVKKGNNIRNSPMFSYPISKLKTLVYESAYWREICKSLYRNFPEGLGSLDSVILLFAKLSQDNRLDDLRIELIKRIK